MAIVLELDKTHAFRFSRNLYIDISSVPYQLPYQEKALFRRMTSEGEVPRIMKNMGFILSVMSAEITCAEFTVPRCETRRLRMKHRIIKWKREQLRIYLNATFSAYAWKDLRLLIPTMDADGWLGTRLCLLEHLKSTKDTFCVFLKFCMD